MGYGVEDASGETGGVEARRDGPSTSGGDFGGFEDGGVADCEGIGDRADAEDVGGVPEAGLVADWTRGNATGVGQWIRGESIFTMGQWRE